MKDDKTLRKRMEEVLAKAWHPHEQQDDEMIFAFIESELTLAKREAYGEVIEALDNRYQSFFMESPLQFLRSKFLNPSQDATRL